MSDRINHFLKNTKIYIKPYCLWERDYDYTHKLSHEDREWLTQFTNEYINGRFDLRGKDGKKLKSIFLNDEHIISLYKKYKSDPDEFEKLKKECESENRRRKNLYNKHRKKEYDYFVQFINCKDKTEKANLIKKYNKRFCKDYNLKTKLKHFSRSEKTPDKYKCISIKEWIRTKIYRELNNTYKKEVDCLSSDVDLNTKKSNYVEYDEYTMRPEVLSEMEEIQEEFKEYYRESKIILFINKYLVYACDLERDDDLLNVVDESYLLYLNNKMEKWRFYLSMYRVIKVLKIIDIKDSFAKQLIEMLDNIYTNIIFKRTMLIKKINGKDCKTLKKSDPLI